MSSLIIFPKPAAGSHNFYLTFDGPINIFFLVSSCEEDNFPGIWGTQIRAACISQSFAYIPYLGVVEISDLPTCHIWGWLKLWMFNYHRFVWWLNIVRSSARRQKTYIKLSSLIIFPENITYIFFLLGVVPK